MADNVLRITFGNELTLLSCPREMQVPPRLKGNSVQAAALVKLEDYTAHTGSQICQPGDDRSPGANILSLWHVMGRKDIFLNCPRGSEEGDLPKQSLVIFTFL